MDLGSALQKRFSVFVWKQSNELRYRTVAWSMHLQIRIQRKHATRGPPILGLGRILQMQSSLEAI